MAVFGPWSPLSTPTSAPSTPGARIAGTLLPIDMSPGALSATKLIASPGVRGTPVPPVSVRTVGTAATTRVLASPSVVSSTTGITTSGAYCATSPVASIGTIPVPQPAKILSTPVVRVPDVESTSNEQKILRIVSYRAKPGAEAQFSDIMSHIEAQTGSVPGLLDYRGGILGPDYTAMMVFQSQAALDEYRAGQQNKQLKKMLKPFLEGPADFDYQPPLATYIVKQPPGNGHIMSITGYKCADGKETEWKALYDDIMSQMEDGAVPGLVLAEGAFLDTQAFMLGLVLESQSHLDNYKATVREQFLERMRPLLEDDPINELDNEVVCPVRIEIA